jgi:hypothetical protein
MESYENPCRDMEIPYGPSRGKSKAFSADEDKYMV